MSEIKHSISDRDLTDKVRISKLSDSQKKDLVDLIPEMTDIERGKLLNIITRAADIVEKSEQEKAEKITNLNQEYEAKLDEAVREEEKYARVEFEKLENQESENEMKNLEQNLETTDENSARAIAIKKASDAAMQHGGHTVLKFGFFLFSLAGIAVGVLFALNYFSIITL